MWMTLPLENESLAEWFNSGKENGNDEDGAVWLYAGVQARVAHPSLYEVTGAQLAVQLQIKHGEFTNFVLKLKSCPNSPNLFQFERCLFPTITPLFQGPCCTCSIAFS